MPKINISKETHARLLAFMKVMKNVTENKALTVDNAAEVLILSAIDHYLSTLWASDDAELLTKTLHLLAHRHPNEVFSFVAEMYERGSDVRMQKVKQEMREQSRRIGFLPKDDEGPPGPAT